MCKASLAGDEGHLAAVPSPPGVKTAPSFDSTRETHQV